MNDILATAIAPSTQKIYTRGLDLLETFRSQNNLDIGWPIPVAHLVSFIVYMSKQNYSHSTISSYISGISYFNKINDFDDYTQKFIIKKLLEGLKRSKQTKGDSRLPITRDILSNILGCLSVVCRNTFEISLFQAAFSLAFHGFFRVGEITVGTCSNETRHTICIENVQISQNQIELFLGSSKTDQQGRGTTIIVSKTADPKICPVMLMHHYLNCRPGTKGPLFCHFDGAPLTKYQFTAILKRSLETVGINSDHYKSHSFRIGMATTCAMDGMPDEKIQELGRWRSNAYLRYIRL